MFKLFKAKKAIASFLLLTLNLTLGGGALFVPVNVAFAVQPPSPPDTTITSGPSGVTNLTSASFSFTATPSSGATFECRKGTTGSYGACASPKTYTGLTDGSYTFMVKASNSNGTDASPASRSWTVDTTAPNTTITTHPSDPTSSIDPNFDYSSTESGSTFECSFDGGSFGTCPTSGKSYSGVAMGAHTFQVRATDAAGNVDATPASFTWTVARPDLVVTKSHEGDAYQNGTFKWKLHVENIGNASAVFGKNTEILRDDMPSSGVNTYGTPSTANLSGVTVVGSISCTQGGSKNENLTCKVSGSNGDSVTMDPNSSFDVFVNVYPTAIGTLNNPVSGGKCGVDKYYTQDQISESNENNNSCSDSLTITVAPVDVCPNIEGNQETMPSGKELNGDGQCVDIVVTPTCSDGIQNQDETGVDVGGVCGNTEVSPTCSDGIQNQNETGVDVGGVCGGGNDVTCGENQTLVGEVCVNNEVPPPPSGGGSSNFDYWGCTNPSAPNYNALANRDDNSCQIGNGGGGESGGGSTEPQGEVLGAATTNEEPPLPPACAANPYLRDYLKMGKMNDSEQVKLLQTFLNEYMQANLPVTGVFGPLTKTWVKKLQKEHFADIIQPWIDAGHDPKGLKDGSGVVYKTTKRFINMQKCVGVNEPLPELSGDQGL